MRTTITISLALLAGCPKPPPPPSVGEPVRLPAEESCDGERTLPPLPPRPAADPYQLARAELLIGDGHPITFLCDLPDRIVALGATQTVQGGQRLVGGHASQLSRDGATLPTLDVAPSSAGCKPDQPTCDFATSDRDLAKFSMLREQWLHTGGWVSGREDMCRALPDDTIAVCATRGQLAYVELGCAGQLQLGIHDTSLPRKFDLDVEVPVARLLGKGAPTQTATQWSASFANADAKVARYRTVDLVVNLDPGHESGSLVVDGKSEACFVFGLYRR